MSHPTEEPGERDVLVDMLPCGYAPSSADYVAFSTMPSRSFDEPLYRASEVRARIIALTERVERAEAESKELSAYIESHLPASALAAVEGRAPDGWLASFEGPHIEGCAEIVVRERQPGFEVPIYIGTPPPETSEPRVEIGEKVLRDMAVAFHTSSWLDPVDRMREAWRVLRPHLTSPSEPEGEDDSGELLRAIFGQDPDAEAWSTLTTNILRNWSTDSMVKLRNFLARRTPDAGEDEPETGGGESDAAGRDAAVGQAVPVTEPGAGSTSDGPVPEGGEEQPIPIGSPNGDICEDCGTECIDRCSKCGAPQCCPKCCAETPAPEPTVEPSTNELPTKTELVDEPTVEGNGGCDCPTQVPGPGAHHLMHCEHFREPRPEPTVEGEDPWEWTDRDRMDLLAAYERCLEEHGDPEETISIVAKDILRSRIAPEIDRLRAEVERLRGELEGGGLVKITDEDRDRIEKIARHFDPQPQEDPDGS